MVSTISSTIGPAVVTSNAIEGMDIKPGWLALTIFMNLACIGFNMTLILLILTDRNLRKQPSKWLMLNCSFVLMLKGVLLVSKIHHYRTGIPSWVNVTALCVPLELIHLTKIFLTPVVVLQMTIERCVCLIRVNREHSGFDHLATLVFIGAGWIIAIFYCILCAFVMGNIVQFNTMCYISFNSQSIDFYFTVFLLIAFLTLILTVGMFLFYYLKKLSPHKNKEIVLFTCISNGVYLSYQIPIYLLYVIYYINKWGFGKLIDVSFNFYYTYIFILPIVWVLSAHDLRAKVIGIGRMCLSKLPISIPADNAVILEEEHEEEPEETIQQNEKS